MKESGKSIRKAKAKKLKKEKRTRLILYGTLGSSVVFTVFWLIALSTDYWVHLVLPESGASLASRQLGLHKTTVMVTDLHVGLWRHCRVEYCNETETEPAVAATEPAQRNASNNNTTQATVVVTKDVNTQLIRHKFCSQHSFYPGSSELKDRGLDQGILDFRRAATGMAVIGLLMAVTANLFSFYSIIHARYVLRRLAGCLQLVAAACLVVTIQIFFSGLSYAKENVPSIYPPETLYHVFGFSFGLAWVCFTVYVVAGIVFLVHSRKDKSADNDQPVNIGR